MGIREKALKNSKKKLLLPTGWNIVSNLFGFAKKKETHRDQY